MLIGDGLDAGSAAATAVGLPSPAARGGVGPAGSQPQSPAAPPAWSPLRATGNQELADGWALVLESQAIPNHLKRRDSAIAAVGARPGAHPRGKVPGRHDRERRAEAAAVFPAVPDQGWSAAGLAMVVVLGAFFWVTGGRDDGDPGRWFREGTAWPS